MKRDSTLELEARSRFKVGDLDLYIAQDLILKSVLNFILKNDYRFEHMLDSDYDVFGIIFCQTLWLGRINVLLSLSERVKGLFIFQLGEEWRFTLLLNSDRSWSRSWLLRC
jgi:hypothetical protein